MPPPRRPQPFWVQVADLTRIELTNWRWSWRMMLFLGMLTPLGSILALRLLLGAASPGDLAQVLAGNVVLSLMFENQNRVGGHFVFMRRHGTLEYFGSLPVGKTALVIAVVVAFLLLSLPSAAVILLAGSPLLGVHLALSPLLLLTIPLCVLPMAGIGTLVGLTARSSAEANALGMLVTFLIAGAGAVVIPPTRTPAWLATLGRISPATYAVSALRQTLVGPVTPALATDLAVLAGFSLISFWLVGRWLDWRER